VGAGTCQLSGRILASKDRFGSSKALLQAICLVQLAAFSLRSQRLVDTLQKIKHR
jgi:hypothetical protein